MIPKDLNDEIATYAVKYGISKSGAITMIVKQYLEQQKIMEKAEQVPVWIRQLQEISKNQNHSIR